MSDALHFIALDVQIAVRLIRRQFPELAGCAVRHQPARGTDNHIFRIGDDLCARFPKVAWASGTPRREVEALARFAGAPISVPAVYGLGAPGEGYQHEWSVLSWLPGVPLEDSALGDAAASAPQVADFLWFLRSVPADQAFQPGFENNGRGAPLRTRAAQFEAALARVPSVDIAWASRVWSDAIRADTASAPVWLHGDVHPGNVLVNEGQICGVIDWGLSGVGDGACDLLTAWAMFHRRPREILRKRLGASDADWMRGAGWALSMAVIYLPFAYEMGLRCDMSETIIARLKEEFA